MKDISRKISENYKTIKGEINDEFEIEKSIFITNMKYVESEKEALSFIEKIKEKYKDANHNCHAYIINEKPEIKRYFPKRAKEIRKEPKKSEVIYSRSRPTTER